MSTHKMTAKEFVSWIATHPNANARMELTAGQPVQLLGAAPNPAGHIVITIQQYEGKPYTITVREGMEMRFKADFAPVTVR